MTLSETRRHCPTCPVGLLCMAGRLKILWRCDDCAKLLVEVRPPVYSERPEIATMIVTKEVNQLIECDVNLPVPERDTVLPQLCSKCHLIDRQRDDAEHWKAS